MKTLLRPLLTLLLGLGFCLASRAKADSSNGPRTSFDLVASRLVADPQRGLVYASLTAANSVAVINLAGNSATILPVGSSPVGISISSDGTKLYVALSGATAIAVLDLNTLTVLPSLPISQKPYHVEAGLEDRLYVTPAGSGALLQVNAITGATEATIEPSTYSRLLQISPDRRTLYDADTGISPSSMRSYDVSSATPMLLQTSAFDSTGSNGIDLKLSHNGQLLCFPNGAGNSSTYGTDVFDPANFDVVYGTLQVGAYPGPLAFSETDAAAYEYRDAENKIYLFSTESFLQLAILEVEGDTSFHTAHDIVVDPDGRYLLFADDVAVWVYDLIGDTSTSAFATIGQDFSYQPPIFIASTTATATGLPGGLIFDPVTRTISGVPTEDGTFAIVITAEDGVHTVTVNLSLSVFLNSRALNMSTRALVQGGDDVVIAGFIILGTELKTVVIRAIGPSLPVPGKLMDPTLELHDSTGAAIAFNNDWQSDENAYVLPVIGLAPTDAAEAALYRVLEPGAYTAVIRSGNSTSGVGLAEVYDIDSFQVTRLGNISTRSQVKTGDDVMIGGVIVAGPDTTPLLVRAIGPSLVGFGIMDPLIDPQLDLYDSDGVKTASNDNWRNSQESEIEATGIAPTDDRESAILASLSPGLYTAIVSGVGGTTGVALVETYNVP